MLSNYNEKLESQGKMKLFCNVFVDIMLNISIFCQRIRVISVTLCDSADKLRSWRNLSQGIIRENVLAAIKKYEKSNDDIYTAPV